MNATDPSFRFVSRNEEDTQRLGKAMADNLVGGLFIALSGTLGAGKTRLVQAIAEPLGMARRDVTSPTFALIQVYPARLPLVHIDAYRIADDDEYLELGIEEMCDDESVIIMEWAERFEQLLPDDRLTVNIRILDDTEREFVLSWPAGSRAPDLVAQAVRQALDAPTTAKD